jgi:hypothetical protein
MRNNLTQCLITDNPIEFHKVLDDNTLVHGVIEMLNDNCFMINYSKKEAFVKPHNKYNIALSIFTTSSARVELYRTMDTINQTPNCKLLYTDTDSVFAMVPKGEMPVTLGNYFGELTDEYPDHTITGYYSTGPKAYSLKMIHNVTGEVEYSTKLKGITLNCATSKKVDYTVFKETINNNKGPVKVQVRSFAPNCVKGNVTSSTGEKTFQYVYDKSRVDCNGVCFPFGYKGPF